MQKGHQLEKSTLPPLAAVVTNMSHACQITSNIRTSKLEVILDQTISDLVLYNLQLPKTNMTALRVEKELWKIPRERNTIVRSDRTERIDKQDKRKHDWLNNFTRWFPHQPWGTPKWRNWPSLADQVALFQKRWLSEWVLMFHHSQQSTQQCAHNYYWAQ